MNAAAAIIKQGFTEPRLELTLDAYPQIVLVGALSVTFVWRKEGTLVRNTIACTIVDAAARKIAVQWNAASTTNLGIHEYQIEVVDSAGKLRALPHDGFDIYVVRPTI